MQSRMIAGSLGIVAVCIFPDLPSLFQVGLLLALSLICIFLAERYSKLSTLYAVLCRIAGMFLLGVVWGVFYGYGVVEQQLPLRWEGVDLWVQGTVVGLPVSRSAVADEKTKRSRHNQHIQSFNFRIDGGLCENKATHEASCFRGVKLIRLKWYEKKEVEPGHRWRLLVRLKKPRGAANPGGFDYQTWLIAQGFGGNGYVRNNNNNKLLSDHRFTVDALRWRAAVILDQQLGNLKNLGIFKALILGDKRSIDNDQWQLFSRTGTTHLMVISGLHVGLLAALGFVIGKTAAVLIDRRRSADKWGALFSMVIATLYTCAAGFSLPTQRALIMVGVCMVAIFFRRNISPVSGLLMAMFACLTYDPLAAVGLSFWMSFTAVACIFFGVMGRKSKALGPVHRSIKGNISSQYGVYIGLLPVLAMLLGQLSFISPVANILMVPLFTIVIVPMTMLGALGVFVCFLFGDSSEAFPLILGFWQLLDTLVSVAFNFLRWLDANNTYGLLYIPGLPWSVKWVAMLGAAVLLLPKGFPLKFAGLVLLVPLVSYRPSPLLDGDMTVTVLDVGQGLSVVVQTRHHRLVYDTGPAVSDSFSAAATAVIPFLRYQGIASIDTLVLSHGDNDHAGGLAHMLEAMPIEGVYYGEKIRGLPAVNHHCDAGTKWTWNHIDFAFFTASGSANANATANNKGARPKQNPNDLSCVMMITAGDTRFLFTGDIGHKIERQLLNNVDIDLAATVLMAPHHGSLSSSSLRFVERVQAEHVVFSSGYKNQFRHPRPEVVERYLAQEAQIHATAEHGAITFSVHDGKLKTVSHYRDTINRYWL